MPIGKCKLCLLERDLCESHALPHSLFNYALRQSAGKVVALTNDEATFNQHSSDTWQTFLFCAGCEDKLNQNYDRYGMGVFRGVYATITPSAAGVTFKGINRSHLRMFFLSVLWRISVSKHEAYRNIDLPYPLEDELHSAIVEERKVANPHFAVRLHRLRDSTGTPGLTNEKLRGLVIAPEARQQDGFKSIYFLCLGFVVEISLTGFPKKYLAQSGVLAGSSPVFMAPYWEVRDFPPITATLAQGLKKHDAGLTRIRVGRDA
ncbi:MAG: hypothetical protein Q7U63_00340 [Polaromonas sp.]|uniref:hypothetical protein n=1 Tax=Polaromonas sp. TaxID=1869339 RepID=UPI00271592DB|nr:hypothetical protein [Polaromonas sp.]MDO9112225.1 hypothetical protein [Polaromonas sp.]MDP1888688.1 hypothetical protein [Polaromonas sp.]